VSLPVPGLLWFGAYVAIVLLPLAVAAQVDPVGVARSAVLEFGIALGFIGFAVILAQFALVSRLSSASRPFGTDALMQFHRQIGVVAVALIAAHPFFVGAPLASWTPFAGSGVTRTGASALWAMLILVATSLLRRRLRLSYEAWQILHLATAVVLAVAMLAHVFESGTYTSARPMRWLVAGYAGGFLALTLRYRIVRPLLIWTRPWEVVWNRDEGARTRTIRVRPVRHAGFTFEPGQFAWLITGRRPVWSEQHPISISSSSERSDDGGIEFSIKARGDWSSRVVPTLAPGQQIWVDGPFGAFTPDRVAAQGFVLLAGGIGIAPMRAILQTMRDRGDRRHVLLIYAARDETRLLFREEFEALKTVLSLDVVYVLEEPSARWRGERGLITREWLARQLPSQYRRYQFFVCGPVPMMDVLEEALTSFGIPAGSIQTERFQMA
jgi:predicted ferric reductase